MQIHSIFTFCTNQHCKKTQKKSQIVSQKIPDLNTDNFSYNNNYQAYKSQQIRFSGKAKIPDFIIKKEKMTPALIEEMYRLEADAMAEEGVIYNEENRSIIRSILEMTTKKDKGTFRVAYDNNYNLVGMSVIIDAAKNFVRTLGNPKKMCILHMEFVKKDFRGKGCFKKLGKSLLKEAKKLGYEKAVFDTENKTLIDLANRYPDAVKVHTEGDKIYEMFRNMIHDSDPEKVRILSIDLNKLDTLFPES